MRRRDLPRPQAYALSALRITLLLGRGIYAGRFALWAASLTYYSMLSIVPVLAIAFGVAKGFGVEKTVEQMLYENFVGQEAVIDRVVLFANKLLANVAGGLMAAISLGVLFWSIFNVLSQIEKAFNEVWGVSSMRPPGRRIVDYLALVIILPFLLFFSSTATVFITTELNIAAERMTIVKAISPALIMLFRLSPFVMLWLLFSYLYIFMPNARVRWASGILAGVLAGSAYQLFQSIYIASQVGLSRYNAVYGSFAALPLFIFWLHISWTIVLVGAELAYAHQWADSYEFEEERRQASLHYRQLASLAIMHHLIHCFADGVRCRLSELTEAVETPPGMALLVIDDLIRAGLVSEVRDNGKSAYQPAMDPDRLTIGFVLGTLCDSGSNGLPLGPPEVVAELDGALAQMYGIALSHPTNRRLKEIPHAGMTPVAAGPGPSSTGAGGADTPVEEKK